MVEQETQLSLTNARRICANVKHTPPHMCYHTEFGCSALKGVGINTGKPPKLGRPGTPLALNGRRG